MQSFVILAAIVILAFVGFWMGNRRAIAQAGGWATRLHSLPFYHGFYVALWCGVPGLVLFLLWLVAGPQILEAIVLAGLPPEYSNLPSAELGLLKNEIRNLANGDAIGTTANAASQAAAEQLVSLRRIAYAGLVVAVLAIAVAG
ncbi:MAG: phosphate ABC transporter permease family protein, partial [Dongiaceae bacterium]